MPGRIISLPLLLLTGWLASAGYATSSSPEKLAAKIGQTGTNAPATPGFELKQDQTRMSLEVKPGSTNNAPTQAKVSLRQQIGDQTAFSYSSELGMKPRSDDSDAPGSGSPGGLTKKDVWAMDWKSSHWLRSRLYSENQAALGSGAGLLQQTHEQHGLEIYTQPHRWTQTGIRVHARTESKEGIDLRERIQADFPLSQRLGLLPLTLETVPGLAQEEQLPGGEIWLSRRLEQSLRWDILPGSSWKVGSSWQETEPEHGLWTRDTTTFYSRWSQSVLPQIRFDFESNYQVQDMAGRNTPSPAGQTDVLNLRVGPRIDLGNDWKAGLEFKHRYEDKAGGSVPQSEQALSLSLQSRF